MNNRHLDYKTDNSNYQISENELYLTDYIAIVRIHLKNYSYFFDGFMFRLIHIAKFKV